MKAANATQIFASLCLCFSLLGCNGTQQQAREAQSQQLSEIPTPAQMRAEVLVNGRISQIQHIDIQHVGKKIPYTYSQGKISNSKDYQWWVSKHFALKSDLSEDKIRLYLELLELSYPHYVSLFGAEPPNIQNQRIAVVYGSSREKVRQAMLDDGFLRGVHQHAGGETMYYNRAGYSFPSHRLQHQRYIVIHETMHAFHMALTGHSTWAPNWITEGLADSIAHHVYDPKLKQLSVMVFDRAPMNYVETGLRQYQEGGQPSIAQINDDPALKRGLNFFIVHFLLNDPQRAQYFALFRDKLMAADPHSEDTLPVANQLLKQTFPNWQQLEQEFAHYVQQLRSSFHIAAGPWEQDGNSYWIRSGKQKQQPRLDIQLPSGQQTVQPQFDFPAPAVSELLSFEQASREQFGLLIAFVAEQQQRGELGLALGVQLSEQNQQYRQHFVGDKDNSSDSYLQVLLKQGQFLHINGINLSAEPAAFALSQPLIDAVTASQQLGVSLQVTPKALELTLRSGQQQQAFSYAINSQLAQRLKGERLSLLANDVGHKLTPYLADGRQYQAVQQTAANPWHYRNMPLLQRVFRACQQQQLALCNPVLQQVFTDLAVVQQHSAIDNKLQQLHGALLSTADEQQLATLSGIQAQIAYHQQQPGLRLINPGANQLLTQGKVTWLDNKGQVLGSNNLPALTLADTELYQPLAVPTAARSFELQLQHLWMDNSFNQQLTAKVKPFDGVWMTANASIQQQQLNSQVQISGPYSGKTHGTLKFQLYHPSHPSPIKAEQQVVLEPYQQLQLQQLLPIEQPLTGWLLDVQAELEVDGEALLLQQKLTL